MARARIRVAGLVRLKEKVRAEAGRGLRPEAIERLRGDVADSIAAVEESCRARGVTTAALPRPTRGALGYLRQIDFDALPRGDRGLRKPTRLRGVVAGYERLADRAADSAVDLARVSLDAAAVRDRVEALLAPADSGAVGSRTAMAAAALADLAGEEYVARLRETAERLRAAIASHVRARPGDRRVAGKRIVVRIRRTTALWRARWDRATFQMMLSDAFVGAPAEVLAALVGAAVGAADVRKRPAVEHWLAQRGPRRAPLVAGAAMGLVHDLGHLFDELNGTHFAGALGRPALGWTSAPTVYRFGSYVEAEDRVAISATLDRHQVPRFVVAYVLFHELLHKHLGARLDRAGRRRVHTAEFRRRERAFPRYEEAAAFLDDLARRWRRAR